LGPKLGRQLLDRPQVAGGQHHRIAALGPEFGQRAADPAGADEADPGLGSLPYRGGRQHQPGAGQQKRAAGQGEMVLMDHRLLHLSSVP
jgi:hypothetical protein